ncbi:dapper 1-like [Cyclopterus lumpus]|uniref:dapper 1-like n=1 Tax=Cyclopterus lumpus TaxID=8103 RepID=UPI0014865612|nr:dapper 1-like [Cyclopterus lumpus]
MSVYRCTTISVPADLTTECAELTAVLVLVMFPAYSLAMKAERRRNKERLEDSLVGLCELELLKQRQQCRVLSALCLEDSPVPGRPPLGALPSARCAVDAPNANASDGSRRRLQNSRLHCMPCGMKASLEQQVAELKVNTKVQSTDSPTDCQLISVSDETGETETGETDLTRWATITGALGEMRDVDPNQEDFQQAHNVKTYLYRLIQCQALPPHSSKLRTSLAHDVRVVNVVRQSSICRMEKQHSPKQLSVQGSMINTFCSTLLEYPSCRVLQAHPDSGNGELISPQHFHNYPSPHQPLLPEEQLVKAEYIPAHPCRAFTRAYTHHNSNPYKGTGVSNQTTYSPERNQQEHHPPAASQIQPSRSRGGPNKCHLNEDRNGASSKPGKKACMSQSENSLQRVPDRKCNTVERGGGGSRSRSSQCRSKKQQQGGGSCRRCQSTLELSQDETDQPSMQAPMRGSSASNQRGQCTRRTSKSRPIHAYPHHHHSHHHQHMEYQLERVQVPLCQPSEEYPNLRQGESESSMSEADSPESSSLSSDSDESGGLVWPQQLPPQLSLPSPSAPPLQPKAFVKIKASHALKKKILRFRTGSLKVMTTV